MIKNCWDYKKGRDRKLPKMGKIIEGYVHFLTWKKNRMR